MRGAPLRALGRSSRRLAALASRQDGVALALALVILGVFTIAAVSVVMFTSSNSRSAAVSRDDTAAFSLGEAGIAEALAVLHAAPNPYFPYLLPTTTSTYDNGTATWSGTIDPVTGIWTITSEGEVANPTGPGTANVDRTVTATVDLTAVSAKPRSNPIWNYIYASRTGDPDGCDLEIRNSSDVLAPVYAEGNLCVGQTTRLLRGPVVSKGYTVLENPQNSIGQNGQPISEAHIANGCRYKNQPWHNPCQGAPDNIFAQTLTTAPLPVTFPTPDWDEAYLNASPGPYYPCAVVSGNPPVFDNDQGPANAPNAAFRNNSVPGPTHLTPAGVSYTCRTANGELSWDAVANVLTVAGTIFIDGSIEIQNGQINDYNGQATIFVSGTILIKNSGLCAAPGNNSCDSNAWDAAQDLIIFVSNGNGEGQVGDGESIELKSGLFQGGLMGTNTVLIDTTSDSDGPMLADTVVIGQTVDNFFPLVDLLPAGSPGDPVPYATISPPKIFG